MILGNFVARNTIKCYTIYGENDIQNRKFENKILVGVK